MKNEPVYYIPSVRMVVETKTVGTDNLKIGEEYPIAKGLNTYNYRKSEITIVVSSTFCNTIVTIPIQNVELFVKVAHPMFKLSEIVKVKGTNKLFRIYEHCNIQGKLWYRDGWSIATGFESGSYEEDLEKITEADNDNVSYMYNDKLVSEKKPHVYFHVMRNKI